MSSQPTYSGELSPKKRALLALLLKKEQLGSAPSGIPRRDPAAPAPMSFSQQRLWFLDQLAPETSAYNMRGVLRLVGALDVAVLARSLNEIVRRHEALRTTFPADGRDIQIIAPSLTLPVPLIDLARLPEDARESQMLGLARAEGERPFDLMRGPLLRAVLLRLSSAEHIFVFTIHHIVSDGWSLGVLIQELAALYAALVAGRPAPLPELPIQYADYAVWQQRWLESPAAAAQLAYWQQQLAGDLPALTLPTDRAQPAALTSRGAHHTFRLPRRLADELQALNRREETTLFMTLLTGFAALLARSGDETDIRVGTVIAGRNQAETAGLIGCFINTLVIRVDMAGNPAVRAALARVRAMTLAAYAHQDLPFERLLAALQHQRDLGQRPLFQVLFALQNAPIPALTLPGLTLYPVDVPNETAIFDLRLDLFEVADGVEVIFEYNADMFEAATIARMAGHFQTVLDGMVADPTRRLADLPLLSAAEREQLLVTFNAPGRPREPIPFALQQIAAQVARTPDAVAVVFDGPATPLPPPARGGTELPPPAREGIELPPPAREGIELPPPAREGIELPPPAGGGIEGGAETRSQESGVRISGAQHPIPNTQHPTPNTQHPTPSS